MWFIDITSQVEACQHKPVSALLLLPRCRMISPLLDRCIVNSKHLWSGPSIDGRVLGAGS